jgi:stage II sporulation protein D
MRTSLTLQAGQKGAGPWRVRSLRGTLSVNGRPYRGTAEVRKRRNGRLQVINELDIEDYLKGVIAAEVPSDWEMEALKAQAVASRTYALYQKRESGKRSYHIRDTVDSQVYLGFKGERARAVRAVEETKGEVVLYDGNLAAAFYHASCGGHTEDALVLWGIDEPYLKGVDCDCQRISAYGLWEKRFSIVAVMTALRREGYRIDAVRSVESGMITPGGRVMNVLFRSRRGTLSVPSEVFRSALGYSRVPSIFFEPELIDEEVVFSGRGLGHGVGLCQWGAREMAQRGYDYRAILRHYYPGTSIGRI